MVKKDQKWEWTKRQKKTFKELKERFTKELVLVVPDLDKKMRIEVDTLDYAMGGSVIYRVQRWEVATSSLPFKISK